MKILTAEELKNKLVRKADTKNDFTFTRELTVDKSTLDSERMYVEFSVSSEYPVRRWFGYEILDHDVKSIRAARLNSGAAHRDGHYGDQTGVVDKWWIDENKKLRVGVRYSKNNPRAVMIFKDIEDDIRKNVSVEYDIWDLVLDREEDGVAYYRMTDWEPIHTCDTPDGADPNVGHGRSKNNEQQEPESIKLEGDNLEAAIEKHNRDSKLKIIINQNRSHKMTDEEKKQKDAQERTDREAALKLDREAVQKAEVERIKSIHQIAEDFRANIPHVNVSEKVQEYIQQNRSFKEFYDYCSAEVRSPEAKRTPEVHPDFTNQQFENYSIARAILGRSDDKFDGIEKEAHDFISKKIGRDVGKGILIPTNVFGRRNKSQRTTQNVATPTAGGNTVFETPTELSFIEFLHNNLAFVNMGITVISNFQGDFPLVKEGSEHTFSFKPESTSPDASSVTFTKESYGPKLGGSLTTLSRQILLQSPNISEAWARRKLLGATLRGMDRSIIYTSANGPTGLKDVSGVGAPVLGAGFTYNKAIDVRQSVKALNAELGKMSFICNPVTCGTLQKIDITNGYGRFLCDENNKMVGRECKESNQIDEGDLIYGHWPAIMLIEWGYILIEANPWGSGWAAGDIQVKANVAMNVAVEYPQSFAVVESVSQ